MGQFLSVVMWQVTLIRLPYFLAHIVVFIILLACAEIQEGVFFVADANC
jgi:hypothetical protein